MGEKKGGKKGQHKPIYTCKIFGRNQSIDKRNKSSEQNNIFVYTGTFFLLNLQRIIFLIGLVNKISVKVDLFSFLPVRLMICILSAHNNILNFWD